MISSMTGFGSAETITEAYSLKIEIKTLNSKFFDPIIKIPRDFSAWEIEIKNTLEQGLKRGKVNMIMDFIPSEFNETPIHINDELFEMYYNKFRSMARKVNGSEDELFKAALYAPDVIIPKEGLSTVIKKEDLLNAVTMAVEDCNSYRAKEGKKLEEALLECSDHIEEALKEVEMLDSERIGSIRERIQQSVSELKDKVQYDENRFEQELIYYIEKLDISEEKVRLKSHLDQFREAVGQVEPNGKKLGFISQELGREINTIGSKANDAGMQKAVVSMKEALEKIKEQTLNVL